MELLKIRKALVSIMKEETKNEFKILEAANTPESAEDLQKCFEIMNKWEG